MLALGVRPAPPTVNPVRPRRAVNLMAMVVLMVGLSFNVDLLQRAGPELGKLPVGAIGLLVVGAVAYRALQTALLGKSLRQLRWRHAMVVSEAYTGCSNSMVGGAAVGTSVKTAMLRSWGIDNSAIVTSITLTAIVPSLAMWSLALANTAPQVLAGTSSTNQAVVAVAAVTALLAQAGFWWLAVVDAAMASRLATVAGALSRHLARGCVGPLRLLRPTLVGFDPHRLADQMRQEGRQLIRRRGIALLAVGVSSQLSLVFVLAVALHGLGANQASLLEIVQVFAMARVAASFVPLPGGLGALDVGLFTGLVHAGAPSTAVVAALGLYRAVTFGLPILTGCSALFWWRRQHARREQRSAGVGSALEGDRAPEAAVRLAGEGLHIQHRVERQGPVEMGKDQVLVGRGPGLEHQRICVQPVRVDDQQNQVGTTPIVAAGGQQHLVGLGQMDEALTLQAVDPVLAQ